ncbi:ParA family protein [Acinetobacter lwoffii]|jgi:chromosome partitioning protein|uniref:Chromosome partitioning protein n=1 Tax=Acinetobacter lwoffii TaxID=28090 RepID=A0AAW8AWL9_ACILW|nr:MULTISPECIES: ParA family protein [Acinetobacter]KGH48823.1 cobalamin biosynthesis protein CobQ [Acinetobacter idrijaensis]ODN53893.1 cobalamin biosynthesis protein CobQ [Acinetobacter sp. 51m]RDC51575.1 ParA family protein [Acinetobacter sp. RIT592]AUC06567.1 ParA family protein [Acinetobacter lwoffii]EEY89373.1 CobQ/CobB/MinD/ParA nucleotide binding domain protein [Acinetobacter lwoffii SH145]
MRTRVVFNQKGGVGKSSITVNLAAISAHQGLKTLLIDLDPQANSSQYVLGDDATYSSDKPALEPNIENYFEDVLGNQQSKGLLGNAIGSILKSRSKGLESYVHQSSFKHLDVIPASPTLGALAHALESKHKIYKLRDALQQLSGHYDRVFIDTPPAFNFFTLSALIAANRVLIPFDCDVFSKRALQTLIENVIETQDDHNEGLEIEGIVVNQFQAQAKLPREVVQQLKDEGLPVLDSMLPPSILMKESHQKNQPLIHLATDHKLTQAYQSLFNEIEQN